ncbi:hypothetical protein HII12_003760 [Brettanomyces bruxellensis]|uniref:4-hydroxybenzoate polyprenyltransferase, mitochondrial n=1 Tax=Dekkera bruxellensis TaxID=5007 RepID=A0A8H6BD96_DEKBR|nr:hypothetical protein HII12_003760 [Brettanomyces bruxellensis]
MIPTLTYRFFWKSLTRPSVCRQADLMFIVRHQVVKSFHHPAILYSLNKKRAFSTTPKQRGDTVLPTARPGRSKFTEKEIETAKQERLDGLGVLKKFPEKWIPYMELMRIEKPAGTWLLLSPCMWAITMAGYMTFAPFLSTAWMLGVFSVGAFVMRGAGCTINDIWDRDLDNKVARTIERPITSGRVSVKQAVAFLGAQCMEPRLFFLVATYPLFKRFTYYPQAMLAACFNWGALLGFPAMGVWNWSVMIPLYLSGFFWCMHYDTVYGHQDKKYDVKVGIKSTALAWGKHSKPVFVGLAVAQMSCLTLAGLMAGMGPGFYTGTFIAGFRLFNMIRKVNLDNPVSCGFYFRDNIKTGHVIWLGILLDYILQLLGFL